MIGDIEKTSPQQPGADAEDVHEKVPEAAENFEHTLRRLAAEKEEKRSKNPGLYR